MTPQERIRLARRHAALSQAKLALAVGVQRSAVSHWETAQGKTPTSRHLREIALACGVQYEWLATGRGRMHMSAEMQFESVAAADALLVDDVLELRLIEAFREVPVRARAPFVELVEQMAELRTGRQRGTRRGARRPAGSVIERE